MSYTNAEEVREIATKYINEYHSHLANAPIEYLFNAKTVLKKGKEVLGEIKLVTGLNAFLITRDYAEPQEQIFVMIISKSAWDLLADKPQYREAIVDHELQHANRDLDTGALSLLPHDIEEFNDIVRRHGAWKQDIANFLKASGESKVKQIAFDFRLARENQEKDAAKRGEGEHDEIPLEQAAVTAAGIKLVKQEGEKARRSRKNEEDARPAAAGE